MQGSGELGSTHATSELDFSGVTKIATPEGERFENLINRSNLNMADHCHLQVTFSRLISSSKQPVPPWLNPNGFRMD